MRCHCDDATYYALLNCQSNDVCSLIDDGSANALAAVAGDGAGDDADADADYDGRPWADDGFAAY